MDVSKLLLLLLRLNKIIVLWRKQEAKFCEGFSCFQKSHGLVKALWSVRRRDGIRSQMNTLVYCSKSGCSSALVSFTLPLSSQTFLSFLGSGLDFFTLFSLTSSHSQMLLLLLLNPDLKAEHEKNDLRYVNLPISEKTSLPLCLEGKRPEVSSSL